MTKLQDPHRVVTSVFTNSRLVQRAYVEEKTNPPGHVKESATHAGITPDADAGAAETRVFAEAASFSAPLAVWHLKQGHA